MLLKLTQHVGSLTAPLNDVGQISVRYMGEIPALMPELMPITRRPAINISKELAYLALSIRMAPMAAKMLFNNNPVFLENVRKRN